MLLTIEEAKTKLCPMSFNGSPEQNTPWHCCATECVAWNFLTPNQAAAINAQAPRGSAVPDHTKIGYCGLVTKL